MTDEPKEQAKRQTDPDEHLAGSDGEKTVRGSNEGGHILDEPAPWTTLPQPNGWAQHPVVIQMGDSRTVFTTLGNIVDVGYSAKAIVVRYTHKGQLVETSAYYEDSSRCRRHYDEIVTGLIDALRDATSTDIVCPKPSDEETNTDDGADN